MIEQLGRVALKATVLCLFELGYLAFRKRNGTKIVPKMLFRYLE